MPLVKNQIIPLTIDALSSDGNGVGRFEGQAVFVPFAAVGDVLSVKVVKICKSYAFGIVESVLTPGTGRIPADCPIFGRCGGCCFRHLSYEAELAAKQGFVADALRRIGGLDVPVRDILPSPQTERYQGAVSSVSRWGRQCSSRLLCEPQPSAAALRGLSAPARTAEPNRRDAVRASDAISYLRL